MESNRHRKRRFDLRATVAKAKGRESLVQLGKTLPDKDQEKAKKNGSSYSLASGGRTVVRLALSCHCSLPNKPSNPLDFPPWGGSWGIRLEKMENDGRILWDRPTPNPRNRPLWLPRED